MTGVYSILALIFIIIIYFIVPFSRIKSDFHKEATNNIDKLKLEEDIFSEEDIKDLPKPVQKYFRYCGFIGTKKMSMMKAVHKNADFSTGVKKPTSIKAVWHYPAGDQVYFNCNNVKINYS